MKVLVRYLWPMMAIALLLSTDSLDVQAGIYSGPTESAHAIDPAVASNDSRIQAWANSIDTSRTYFAPRGSATVNQSVDSIVWETWTHLK